MIVYDKGDVLLVPDLHLNQKDVGSIAGTKNAAEAIVLDLIKLAYENPDLIVIFLGDVFDKGYTDQIQIISHMNIFQELNFALRGKLHSVLGNHFYLQRDINPMMYLIQPTPLETPIKPIFATKPIINIDPLIRVGCMMFSLHHYRRDNKNYYVNLEPFKGEYKYHHALYHDSTMIPDYDGWFTKSPGYKLSENNYILSNVDMATTGHIHDSLGIKEIHLNNGRVVPIEVPGNLVPVSIAEIVPKIKEIPLYKIDRGVFTKTYHKMNTYSDTLRYQHQKQISNGEEESIQGMADIKVIKKLAEQYHENTLIYHSHLEDFVRSTGGTDRDIELIMLASKGELTIGNTVNLYNKGI